MGKARQAKLQRRYRRAAQALESAPPQERPQMFAYPNGMRLLAWPGRCRKPMLVTRGGHVYLPTVVGL